MGGCGAGARAGGEVLPPTVGGGGCILRRRVHGPATARARDPTSQQACAAPRCSPGLVPVSLSPPAAQRPSRPLRRGRGGGRLTPARQGGWTERTWRQTWGLERNEIYPHPAVLPPRSHPVLPSVHGWVKVAVGAVDRSGQGGGRAAFSFSTSPPPVFPAAPPLPPRSSTSNTFTSLLYSPTYPPELGVTHPICKVEA